MSQAIPSSSVAARLEDIEKDGGVPRWLQNIFAVFKSDDATHAQLCVADKYQIELWSSRSLLMRGLETRQLRARSRPTFTRRIR